MNWISAALIELKSAIAFFEISSCEEYEVAHWVLNESAFKFLLAKNSADDVFCKVRELNCFSALLFTSRDFSSTSIDLKSPFSAWLNIVFLTCLSSSIVFKDLR